MLAVSRFRAADTDAADFRRDIETARATLAACRGYVDGRIGRNLDDPSLWTLVTRWDSVGAYRRALSSYDVKLHAVPLLSRAIDEPSAYELVEDDTSLNIPSTRTVG